MNITPCDHDPPTQAHTTTPCDHDPPPHAHNTTPCDRYPSHMLTLQLLVTCRFQLLAVAGTVSPPSTAAHSNHQNKPQGEDRSVIQRTGSGSTDAGSSIRGHRLGPGPSGSASPSCAMNRSNSYPEQSSNTTASISPDTVANQDVSVHRLTGGSSRVTDGSSNVGEIHLTGGSNSIAWGSEVPLRLISSSGQFQDEEEMAEQQSAPNALFHRFVRWLVGSSVCLFAVHLATSNMDMKTCLCFSFL